MKKADEEQRIYEYIRETTGIAVSKMLLSFILNPEKLYTLNNAALKKIVIEYAPIFNKYRYMIDGPSEQNIISSFGSYLSCRIVNKPELQSILDTDIRKLS